MYLRGRADRLPIGHVLEATGTNVFSQAQVDDLVDRLRSSEK